MALFPWVDTARLLTAMIVGVIRRPSQPSADMALQLLLRLREREPHILAMEYPMYWMEKIVPMMEFIPIHFGQKMHSIKARTGHMIMPMVCLLAKRMQMETLPMQSTMGLDG